MIQSVKKVLAAQYEATYWMLHDCIEKCPPSVWNKKVAKYPFWQVAYHALCFGDLTARSSKEWKPHPKLHPKGVAELREEYPSRRFSKGELLEYVEICREKARAGIKAETVRSLASKAGFSWYDVSRLELHVISLRHIQHHTGQLGALLRKHGKKPGWCGSGWKI